MSIKNLLLILFLFTTTLSAQKVINGTITDTDGIGLPGVNVTIKNTTQGTISDFDGNYSIEVPNENATIVFSFIGMQSQEILVGNQSKLDVVLQEDVKLMDEVVVVGYGTQKRSNISGAVSVVTADDIKKLPSQRLEQALQGQAAGVFVAQNSGSPGAEMTVRLRGASTTGNSDPLYIVDGMPVSGLDFLNPNDIESMSLLKDAASAAIYGARGANGVVVITTKQGSQNKPATIEYNGYYGVQSVWKKLNLLNAEEYALLDNEARIAAGIAPRDEFANPSSLGEGTDWQDEIFEDAAMQNHQISVTGGSQKSTYAFSANYFDQDGIVGGADKSNLNRTSLRLNNTHQLNKRIKMGTSLGFTHLTRDALNENNEFTTPIIRAINIDPVTPVTLPNGKYAWSNYTETDIVNPVNSIENTFSKWTSDRLVGNVFGEVEIIENLKFRSSFGVDVNFAVNDGFTPSYGTWSPEVPANERNDVNFVFRENHKWRTWLTENTLTYQKTFNEKHDFTFLAGFTAQDQRYQNQAGSRGDLATNDPQYAYFDLSQDAESSRTWGGVSEESWLSYLGRVQYSFMEKYLFAATIRRDGSSKFGKNNRFGTFPSVSAGWILTKEPFLQDKGALTFLKVRASWGQNGNDRIPAYGFIALVDNGLSYTFGPEEVITNGIAPTQLSNADLKWETVTQTDLGIDIGLWNEKLMFTTDFYIKKTNDMLVDVPVLDHIGAEPAFVNAGNVENRGVELGLNYRKAEGEFNYNLGANVAFNKNEVTSLGGDGDPIVSGFLQQTGSNVARTDVGQPIASFYGFMTDGLFQNEAEVAAGAQPNASPGDIRFVDLNNDGVINDDDRTYIGNPTPKMLYSFTGGASFKGIDFSLFIQGVEGNDIYNGITRYDFNNVNVPNSRLNRWTGEGTSFDEPRVVYNDPNQNARVSDRFVEDGSYLRIKNVQLGYTLPKQITQRAKIQKVRIYVSAQNLFTFTDYSGFDPEIGVRNTNNEPLEIGIDRGFYPQSRVYLGGINVSF